MKTPTIPVTLLAALLALSTPASANRDVATLGALDCRMSTEQKTTAWIVELDASIPIAVLDDNDLPAEYSNNHIQIKMAFDGPTLTIGRETGRLLLSDQQGKTMGSGRCHPVAFI